MSTDPIDYAEINRRVEKELKKQRRNGRIGLFVPSLAMYLVFLAICWGMALRDPILSAQLQQQPSALGTILMMLTIGWGSSLFFHFMSILGEMGVFDRTIRDRVLVREIAEVMLQQGAIANQTEKPKRNLDADDENDAPEVRLSYDGELVPVERERQAIHERRRS